METQATRTSFAHKALAASMSVVLALGLCPMAPYGASEAYAADDLSAAQASALEAQAVSEFAYSGEATVFIDAAGEDFGMFRPQEGTTAKIEGDNVVITYKPKNTTVYNGFYLGADITDESTRNNDAFIAVEDEGATYNITLPVSYCGFAWPIVPTKVSDGGTTKDQYYLAIPSKEEIIAANTEIELTVDSSKVDHFNVPSAALISKGTQVRITMGSDSYGKVALAKKKDADDAANYAIADKQVVVPVSELGGGKRITTSWWSVSKAEWYERDITFNAQAKTLTFDVTENLVEAVDKLGTVEAVQEAIKAGSLVVTPGLVDDMIAAIQVQARNDKTDFYCATAKILWDALSAEDQAKVEEGDYYSNPTGDASKDDPLNADKIGENEILVVSFGTSFNDSRVATIGAVEKAIAKAFPDWSVRRAFTAQIIINHIQSRDGIKIDNMDQALDRAVANGVKNLIVAPTHLMHGAEYDELVAALKPYESKIANISVSEPLLGPVGATTTEVNADKETVAKAAVAAMAKDAGYADAAAAAKDGAAFVFMGHGTGHAANITYNQMQAQMDKLGYSNVFIGTVEGEPKDTECSVVLGKVKDAGYTKVYLRPLMVVAGDHANNDMADPEDPESWYSQFKAAGAFGDPVCQINGLGEIPEVQQLYVSHVGVDVAKLTPASAPAKKKAKVNVTKSKTVKAKALKKKAASFTAIKLTTDGKATYKVTKNSNKKVLSFKAGKVTVKKGAKKGKYSLTVKVSAKAGKAYNALKAKTCKITVTVK